MSGSSEDKLLLRESEPGAEGHPSPGSALIDQGMVLQYLTMVGRDGCWKQDPSTPPSRESHQEQQEAGLQTGLETWLQYRSEGSMCETGLGTDSSTA